MQDSFFSPVPKGDESRHEQMLRTMDLERQRVGEGTSGIEGWHQHYIFVCSDPRGYYFLQLPPETSSVYVYGVPNWGLNGGSTISINRPGAYHATMTPYDAPPRGT